MGIFSIFRGAGPTVLDQLPLQTVTVDKRLAKKNLKKQRRGKENESSNSNKKTRGWFNKKKKTKRKRKNGKLEIIETPAAPNLGIFLQRQEDDDNQSLNNHSVGTGSLTASLTVGSLPSSYRPFDASQQHESSLSAATGASFDRPVTPEPQQPLSQQQLHATRPKSSTGLVPPPLHKSFPMDGVAEDSGYSSSSLEEIETTVLPSSPLHHKVSITNATMDDDKKSEKSDDTAESSDYCTSPEQSPSSSPQHIIKKNPTNTGIIKLTSPPLYNHDNGRHDDDDDDDRSALEELMQLDLHNSSTDIGDLLLSPEQDYHHHHHHDSPLNALFEQDFFSAIDSENATFNDNDDDNDYDSANEDLAWHQDANMKYENLVSKSNFHVEFDLDVLVKSIDKSSANNITAVVEEAAATKLKEEEEMTKTFDQLVNEVEETIVASRVIHDKNGDKNGWIPNGLLASAHDDASTDQQSTLSFSSDDFKEEEVMGQDTLKYGPKPPGLGISMILEEDEGDDDGNESKDPIDAAILRGLEKSNEEDTGKEKEKMETLGLELQQSNKDSERTTIPNETEKELRNVVSSIVDSAPAHSVPEVTSSVALLSSGITRASSIALSTLPKPSIGAMRASSTGACPQSALLSKNLPRRELKRSVSWKDETDVFTYLPPAAQDLQKARDLVATYGRIMAALNNKNAASSKLETDEEGSKSSDADLSDASSESLESLISILSHASSTSSASVKAAIEKIAQETAKLGGKEKDNILTQEEKEKEHAHKQVLNNEWSDPIEINESSSSIETLLSALSSGSNESVKQVVQKLKEEAEKKVVLSSQQLKEELIRSPFSSDSSMSSATSASISMASSTGTSDSVKALMSKLIAERERQVKVFSSTKDMFSLLHNNNEQQKQAHSQIMVNSWVDDGIECGSSSDLSSLLSASPTASASTNDSSESVLYMIRKLKDEKERHKERRKKIRSVKDFVSSVCTFPSVSSIGTSQKFK